MSHGNRRFGTQKDPHPHKEVINAIDKMGFPVAYTNDVKKNGKTIKEKSFPNPHKYVEIVELYN